MSTLVLSKIFQWVSTKIQCYHRIGQQRPSIFQRAKQLKSPGCRPPPIKSNPPQNTIRRLAIQLSAESERLLSTAHLQQGAVLVSSVLYTKEAHAGKRKTPPPEEPKEKNDPNISALRAKVLASNRRKEAMKASLEKMRNGQGSGSSSTDE